MRITQLDLCDGRLKARQLELEAMAARDEDPVLAAQR